MGVPGPDPEEAVREAQRDEVTMAKLQIPFPDPFGILEDLTDGTFFDPLREVFIAPSRETTVTQPGGVPPDLLPMSDQIEKYLGLLTQAYRVAPCKGCQAIVESGIVAAEVYREMEKAGKTAEQVKNDESFMQGVKEKVQQRIGR
jgi:hypothetical protein